MVEVPLPGLGLEDGNSEEAMGIEIESWVAGNDVGFDGSSSKSSHESLFFNGHSSKNWRSGCCGSSARFMFT